MIASEQRALEIVERVADGHSLTVAQLLAQPFKRATVLARGELVDGLTGELGWSFERTAAFLGCAPSTAHSAKSEWKKAQAIHKRFLPAEAVLQIAALDQHEARRAAADATTRVRELEAKLDELAGATLAEKLRDELGLKMRCAILLAIVIEHYPRQVRELSIFALYDHACVKLNYGFRSGATRDLMFKNAQALKDHFIERGWPEPSRPGNMPGSRVLTQSAAQWLHDRIGSPRLSQIAAQGVAA